MEISLLYVTRKDKIRNEEIRKRSGVRDITEKAKQHEMPVGRTTSQNGNDRWAKKYKENRK